MTLQEIRDERDFVKNSIQKLLENFNEKTGLTITDVQPEYVHQDFISGESRLVLTRVFLRIEGI